MTPILIFLGIPATYAVANVANNILGISVSGSYDTLVQKNSRL